MAELSLHSSVLLLNLNYEPLSVSNVRRALALLTRGVAELLENGRGEVHTSSRSFPIPSVIRLGHMVRRPFLQRRLSRREVFQRDNHTCQYCGQSGKELTLDHVVPRHRGGGHAWENVVSACVRCNHRKAGRSPKEAGMKLLREPRAPRPNPYAFIHHHQGQEEWRPFLPWLS